MQLYFDVRGQQEMGFFTEGIVMDYGTCIFAGSNNLNLKCFHAELFFTDSQLLTNGLELCVLHVDYIDFLSAV